MSMDLSRFHRTFFEESLEGLDAMESALLTFDVGSASAETVNTIFRAAHSIKGGAGTFGFSAIAAFTHHVETLLDRVRSGKHKMTQADVDLLLRAVDVERAMLKAASDGGEFDAAMAADVERALEVALGIGSQAGPAKTADAPTGAGWLIRFIPKPELFASGNDPQCILRELAALGDAEIQCDVQRMPALRQAEADLCYLAWTIQLRGKATQAQVRELFAWVEDECTLEVEALRSEVVAAPVTLAKPVAVEAQAADPRDRQNGGSIRVATEKIDALINLVGELVITQAMLMQQAGQLDPVQNERLLQGMSQLDRNTRMLQEAVMLTRMLPMDFVFSRFPRVVRDLSAKLGKQVKLTTVGENTELDKSVIERIADPLNHLVRNALDHGIETADERRAAGKDPNGTIHLSAAHQGGSILIEVADDGRGLDRARLLAKARERGIDAPDTMSDSEVWQLIFAPGFSTAATVTDVSGRGVGMDVVKKNIMAVGGQVDITTQAGRGMKVSIRLPLTLAILDGMSVAVGGEVFILPLSSVLESLQPQAGQIKCVTESGNVIRVRNEYLTLVDLRDWFGLPGERKSPETSIVVIVEGDGHKLAVQVDELVGQQQVVIKSLEANYRRVRGISGATILGDGRVSLILDVAALVRLLAQSSVALAA